MRWAKTLLLVSLLPGWLEAQTGAALLREIRGVKFSPEQCHRVRDLSFEREDVKFHFGDGYLLFADPVQGRSLAALFLTLPDGGEAEVIVMPPSRSERQSLARFAGAPVLQESIRTAMMFFTDGTTEMLRRLLADNPFNRVDAEAGQRLAPDWTTVARNMVGGYETRMLVDMLTPQGTEEGFFAAPVSGASLGRFDILVDPRRLEQISIGQVVWQEGTRYYDIWTSFPARSFRDRRRSSVTDRGHLEAYRIEATLSPELHMQITTHATLVAGVTGERAISFELSHLMKVSRILLDGRRVEFLQNEPLDSSEQRRRGNDWLVVALDEPVEPGSRHQIEFQYAGDVITEAGRGVYYVGSRGNWYPSRSFPFTSFDLVFRYPKRLHLVATGTQVENTVEGDLRMARWKTDAPVRLAGFNLGDFERTSIRVGDQTLEVCANRQLETALQPPPVPLAVLPWPISPVPGGRGAAPPRPIWSLALPTPEPPPPPASRLHRVARESAQALEFFSSRFGPPPLRHLTISPIPGRFGQGFPGLIYVSTLSYYEAEDKPLEKLSPDARVFFSEQLRAHEIAHQWWGNLISSSSYHDDWLMESLADYSALLFLEHEKGVNAIEGVLAAYKEHLLAKTESGDTVESAGAIILGERLRTSKTPRALRTITYEKGVWILHMLRRVLGDPKFFSLLSELRRRFEYKRVSTEDFRLLAAQFLPATPQDPNLENFFQQWVYSTGIPALKLEYKVSGKAPRVRLTGAVRQSGVPDDFSVTAPVEIHLPVRGEKIDTRVPTANGEAQFTILLPQRPTRVLLDPKDSLLAVKP